MSTAERREDESRQVPVISVHEQDLDQPEWGEENTKDPFDKVVDLEQKKAELKSQGVDAETPEIFPIDEDQASQEEMPEMISPREGESDQEFLDRARRQNYMKKRMKGYEMPSSESIPMPDWDHLQQSRMGKQEYLKQQFVNQEKLAKIAIDKKRKSILLDRVVDKAFSDEKFFEKLILKVFPGEGFDELDQNRAEKLYDAIEKEIDKKLDSFVSGSSGDLFGINVKPLLEDLDEDASRSQTIKAESKQSQQKDLDYRDLQDRDLDPRNNFADSLGEGGTEAGSKGVRFRSKFRPQLTRPSNPTFSMSGRDSEVMLDNYGNPVGYRSRTRDIDRSSNNQSEVGSGSHNQIVDYQELEGRDDPRAVFGDNNQFSERPDRSNEEIKKALIGLLPDQILSREFDSDQDREYVQKMVETALNQSDDLSFLFGVSNPDKSDQGALNLMINHAKGRLDLGRNNLNPNQESAESSGSQTEVVQSDLDNESTEIEPRSSESETSEPQIGYTRQSAIDRNLSKEEVVNGRYLDNGELVPVDPEQGKPKKAVEKSFVDFPVDRGQVAPSGETESAYRYESPDGSMVYDEKQGKWISTGEEASETKTPEVLAGPEKVVTIDDQIATIRQSIKDLENDRNMKVNDRRRFVTNEDLSVDERIAKLEDELRSLENKKNSLGSLEEAAADSQAVETEKSEGGVGEGFAEAMKASYEEAKQEQPASRWNWVKERLKGVGSLGWYDLSGAMEVWWRSRQAGKAIDKNMSRLLPEMVGGRTIDATFGDNEAIIQDLNSIKINKGLTDKEVFEKYLIEVTNNVVSEKIASNEKLERKILDESIGKLRDKLGKSRSYRGESLETKINELEQELQERIAVARLRTVEKNIVAYDKLIRDKLDREWWKRLVAGGIELGLAASATAILSKGIGMTKGGIVATKAVGRGATGSWSLLAELSQSGKTVAEVAESGLPESAEISESYNPTSSHAQLNLPGESSEAISSLSPEKQEELAPLKKNLWHTVRGFLKLHGVENPTDAQVLEAAKLAAQENNITVKEWGVEGGKLDTKLRSGMPINLSGVRDMALRWGGKKVAKEVISTLLS